MATPDILSDGICTSNYGTLAPRYPDPKIMAFPISDWLYTLASVYLTSTLIIQIIASCVLLARIYTRTRPRWRLKADDYLICMAFVRLSSRCYPTPNTDSYQVFMTVMWSLQYAALIWAWDNNHPQSRTIDQVIVSSKIGTISLPFWAWSTGLVKISIACMLLRIQQARGWRIFLYSMICINALLVGYLGIGNLFQCIPYQSMWDFKNEIKDKRCWNETMVQSSVYISAVCNVGSDIVFSLLPLSFLGKIHRPRSEKVVIGTLMALGLVASSFSLSKAIITVRISRSQDGAASVTLIGLLSCLEVQTSLIAACIPTLRGSSKRLLQRLGLMSPIPHHSFARDDAESSVSDSFKTARHTRRIHRHAIESNDISTPSPAVIVGEPNEEEDQYVMDSKSGRIVCIPGIKGIPLLSRTQVDDERRRDSGRTTADGWLSTRNDEIDAVR
jgi:hypothetical protein